MDCSLPGSSVHGVFQARVLEWGAIAFSRVIYYHGLKLLLSSSPSWLQVVGFLIILNTVMVHIVFIRAKIPLGKTKTAG